MLRMQVEGQSWLSEIEHLTGTANVRRVSAYTVSKKRLED
jgi:hypothetical protein